MAIEHTLTDADTIQGIAVKYNVSWRDIADYNGLEYPYTMTSLQAYNALYAGGYLKITRELFSSTLTVYKGSTFTTEMDSQGIQRVYEVVEDTAIPAGVQTGHLYVRCTSFGTFGNCIAGAIIKLGQVRTSLGQHISQLTVTNEQPFTNGVNVKVLITGQPIFIPTTGDSSEDRAANDAVTFMNLLGGADIAIAPDGDLLDNGYGDLGGVVGMDNIKQACKIALMTRRGSITQHPTFGSGLHRMVGKANAPYVLKLMELDIIETLSYDDRIEGVVVDSVDVRGMTVYVDLMVTVAKATERFRLELNFGSTP